jgi:hypothetical protein
VLVENSGSLAHDAVRRWIESDGFRQADPRAALAGAVTDAVAATVAGPPADWTMSKARLLARASELATLLTSQPGTPVVSEQMIEDQSRGLRGTPDIVVAGDPTILIDLKTETLAADQVPPWIRFQLTIYSHLIAQQYGALPAQVEIFSLNRGRIPVAITAADVTVALKAVERARATNTADARPDPETCRFCQRRLECEPHWAAAPDWAKRDCLEGTIEHIEHAANGLTALRLRSLDGEAWISGIPTSIISADVGSTIRLVRVYLRQNADDAGNRWRWSTLSSLAAT